MPVYEYRCAGCGHSFAKLFRSLSAVGPVDCPACGRPNAERTLSRFAYHQSLKMKIESLDPRYEKEVAWADSLNPPDPLSRLNLDFSSTGTEE